MIRASGDEPNSSESLAELGIPHWVISCRASPHPTAGARDFARLANYCLKSHRKRETELKPMDGRRRRPAGRRGGGSEEGMAEVPGKERGAWRASGRTSWERLEARRRDDVMCLFALKSAQIRSLA